MRVRFTQDFKWTPKRERRTTIAYKSGMEETVTRACGEAAVAAGKAEEIKDHVSPSVAAAAAAKDKAAAGADDSGKA